MLGQTSVPTVPITTKASSVDISFDSTSDFGATINHSSATTLNVSGGGTIAGATFLETQQQVLM